MIPRGVLTRTINDEIGIRGIFRSAGGASSADQFILHLELRRRSSPSIVHTVLLPKAIDEDALNSQ